MLRSLKRYRVVLIGVSLGHHSATHSFIPNSLNSGDFGFERVSRSSPDSSFDVTGTYNVVKIRCGTSVPATVFDAASPYLAFTII